MGISPTSTSSILLSILVAKHVNAAMARSSIDGAAFVVASYHRVGMSGRFPPPSPSRSSSPASRDDTSDGDDDADGGGGLPLASGSFFHEVPTTPPTTPPPSLNDVSVDIGPSYSSSSVLGGGGNDDRDDGGGGGGMEIFERIVRSTRISAGSSGGGMGFARTTSTTDHAARSVIQTTADGVGGGRGSFVGIGRPLNDVRNPEYDEYGYTLYADETTGEKRRVFEALVSYPSIFEMKIVGRDDVDETRFASDMVDIVAHCCGVDPCDVRHTTRKNGKWTSVTVHAPVGDADMLYALYERVDMDPRVKFKF
ncbi:hypothetical protein ACHAXA_001851 [Cyclostephanos tholiformis]|uniref:Uncharacterized protein n=1 Tax=Cyclostephanos tholiformis TaxID=382380 RepID=A0ABD3RHB4_9STRA